MLKKAHSVLILICFAPLFTACTHGELVPAQINFNEDACNLCRMAVSQRDFAAQAVVAGQNPRFYDDIGCLILDLNNLLTGVPRALYVSEFGSGEWLDVETAFFAFSNTIQSPMGYGAAAFSMQSDATQFVESQGGKVVTFTELRTEVSANVARGI